MEIRYVFFSGLLLIGHVAAASELFPLKVGQYWNYEMTNADQQKVTNRVTASNQIQGENWYQLNEYAEVFWVRNTAQGQLEALNLFETDGKVTPDMDIGEEVIYKYPAKKGETWIFDGFTVQYEGIKRKHVPAGTYKCHSYKIDFGKGKYTSSCIARGIGIVYQESLLAGNTPTISRLLKHGSDCTDCNETAEK